MDCAHLELLSVAGRLAVVQAAGPAGDLALYDASGAQLVRYELPRCEREDPDEDEEDESAAGAAAGAGAGAAPSP